MNLTAVSLIGNLVADVRTKLSSRKPQHNAMIFLEPLEGSFFKQKGFQEILSGRITGSGVVVDVKFGREAVVFLQLKVTTQESEQTQREHDIRADSAAKTQHDEAPAPL